MAEPIDDIEADVEVSETTDTSVLGMSDEEFSKMAPPTIDEDSSSDVPSDPQGDDTKDDTSDEDTEDKSVEGTTTESKDEKVPVEAKTPKDDEKAPVDATKDTPGTPDTEAPVIDYKGEYEKLMAPFKANGTQIQAKSIEDAMSLMQMGANYHKKMAGLKPSLKIVKLLEKNDLLDPDKISYLIDLHSKNPAAITKLMKDSGIDPLDINTENETKYVPQVRAVSDTEMELDEVLESIQASPSYAKTLNVLVEKWDVASRNVIAGNPHIISIINEQVANGIYDQVANAVEHERRFGRLQGLSDLDAYKAMGDQLEAQGLFTHQKATPPVVTTKTPVDDSARKDRKQAVSSTRKTSGKPVTTTINPLAMSDEEFEKLSIQHFK
jgi:hypothetical protein